MKWYVESKAASVAAAAIVLLSLVAAFVILVNMAPRSVADATGVATETTRDIGSATVTPVRYSFNGVERTQLVPYRTALAGDTVTFPVDGEGNPDWGSWPGAMGSAAAVIVLSSALASVVWVFIDTHAMSYIPRERPRRSTSALVLGARR